MDESIFLQADSGMYTVHPEEKQVDFENHAMLTDIALSSALKAQMPEIKDITVSVNGGGGAVQFVRRLEQYYGREALLIPNNPALRRATC